MSTRVIGSLDFTSSEVQVGIEAMPTITDYKYRPAWPRFIDHEDFFTFLLQAQHENLLAAASILKVTQWANGSLIRRRWDVDTVPADKPAKRVVFNDPNAFDGVGALPVYNCASLGHFAAGGKELRALGETQGWSFEPTGLDHVGIVRLLDADIDPEYAEMSDGHWLVGLGLSNDVFDAPHAVINHVGSDEPFVMHVDGGDGPLVLGHAQRSHDVHTRISESGRLGVYAATFE